MSKIKSTINLVSLWPLENRVEDTPVTILSASQKEATEQVSAILDARTTTERNAEGEVTFQCYCKSVDKSEIYEAKIFDMSTASQRLTAEQILDFIVNNGVRLVPTPLNWETSTGEPASYVTHDVYVGKRRYQGMSVVDAIHQHLNDPVKEYKDAE
ncbi:hypothetical protein XbC2_494 [Xanthomonas phage XbC2]|nr:hypothetical protein XbC2_494 [Xanthomonas phage XbC2]